ncbi:hypothetical protein FF38_09814 [Lucilia cuprina]|uniref:Uncharacterized protein n=1 Tax=Lucilia cuprina TaxID=7375 RepID=A0A0L0BNM6_LUCCU|nr:hypothetical protein FF38_09814 [Lucilia cuprina]
MGLTILNTVSKPVGVLKKCEDFGLKGMASSENTTSCTALATPIISSTEYLSAGYKPLRMIHIRGPVSLRGVGINALAKLYRGANPVAVFIKPETTATSSSKNKISCINWRNCDTSLKENSRGSKAPLRTSTTRGPTSFKGCEKLTLFCIFSGIMGLIKLNTGSNPEGVSMKCEALMRSGMACSEY